MKRPATLKEDIPFMVVFSVFCLTVGACVSFVLFKATIHLPFVRWFVELSPRLIVTLASGIIGGAAAIAFMLWSEVIPRVSTDCLWFDILAALLYGIGSLLPWPLVYERYFTGASIFMVSPVVGAISLIICLTLIVVIVFWGLITDQLKFVD